MEEKNRASEMLNQMKKYLHSDEVSEAQSDEPEVKEDSAAEQEKPVKEVKMLPKDEALFEFDDIAFDDDIVIQRPALTPEEAVYAEELSEKFGISKNAGIGFLDYSPAEDGEAESMPEEAVGESEERLEAEEVEKEPTIAPATAQIEEGNTDNYGGEADTEESRHDSPAKIAADVALTGITPTGVQLTFLDANEGSEEQSEQTVLDEGYEADAEENATEEEEPEEEEFISISDGIIAPATEENPISEAEEPVPEEIVVSDVSLEIERDEPEDEFDEEMPKAEQQEYELTPIELNALEEAQRAAAEAEEAEEIERVKQETFCNDIWDEESRKEYAEKKRFADFCAKLDIPPIKITKETRGGASEKKIPSSGYRYEMTERLPLFPDGMGGGKENEGYLNREMEYCEEREKKRSKLLLDKLRLASRRLICSFVVLLVVLLIDNFAAFGGLLYGEYGTFFAISVAVLLAVGAGLVYDSIRDGIKYAISGTFIPETLTAIVAIPSILYHFIIAFCASASEYSMLCGTGAAAVMFLSGLYRYIMLKRDHVAFSVTSAYGQYVTEVRMAGYKNSPEGRAYEGYADPESSLYKLNKVSRIDASYNDNHVHDECYGAVRIIALCIACAAVVAGVVFGIFKKDVVYGVLSALSLITYAAPASVFIALALPRLRAASVAAGFGGAIVDFDDESDEFDANVIMIDEGELFPPDKLVSYEFKFQQSPAIESHLSRTRALFKKIGGSLSSMFSYVEGTEHNFDSVVITEITGDGISAKIDGIPISAGSEVYMKRLGIKVKRGDKLLPKNGRVMYIADGGEFFARATFLFRVNEELVKKISELRNTETLFTLKSCNPCIDDELLFHTTGLEPELIKLIKYEAGDNVAPSETDREGSLVSKNGAIGLLCALLEYKRQKKLILEATRFACISCAAGAIVSIITSIIGVNFSFAALAVPATHGVLSLIAFLMSKRGAINTKSKIKKR